MLLKDFNLEISKTAVKSTSGELKKSMKKALKVNGPRRKTYSTSSIWTITAKFSSLNKKESNFVAI